jgi:hypothetical protein
MTAKVEDRSTEELKREQQIFDRGYEAVRAMAKEMVANGATLADVLFHADQVWHEFKVGAFGMPGTGGLVRSGMYIHGCDREFTDRLIRSYDRYADGIDTIRTAILAAAYRQQASGDNSVTAAD